MSHASSQEPTVFSLDGVELGCLIGHAELPPLRSVTVRLLRPFSWDARDRAFEVIDRPVMPGDPVVVVCGPYAATDAAAWNVDPRHFVGFPESPETDGALYRVAGEPAIPTDRYQDAAGWFTVTGTDASGVSQCGVVMLERSNTQLVVVQTGDSGVSIDLVLPSQVYPVEACQNLPDIPPMRWFVVPGDHQAGEDVIRRELLAEMTPRARTTPPPFISDTWGFNTHVDSALVREVARESGALGVDILTIDKGWESHVGDWVAGDNFPEGVAGIAEVARDNGAKLGLWMALGNADPDSQVATQHPEWLATWRGKTQIVSHHTHSLCLGHGPVVDYLFDRISVLVGDGLEWLLHDFETITRCDAPHHDHDPGLGEDAAVRGWYSLLRRCRETFPDLWFENCWNGGRPLDLQVVAHHDTTIGDDWCDMRHNAVAKAGLGRYLPAHWCSSYMQDEPTLPLASQLVIYAVGGPWILMGNPPQWPEEKTAMAKKIVDVYRRWSPLFPEGHVGWANVSGWSPDGRFRADQEVLAISFRHPDGRELMACVVREGQPVGELIWHPTYQAAIEVTNELTGERWLADGADPAGVALGGEWPNGCLLSVTPASPH